MFYLMRSFESSGSLAGVQLAARGFSATWKAFECPALRRRTSSLAVLLRRAFLRLRLSPGHGRSRPKGNDAHGSEGLKRQGVAARGASTVNPGGLSARLPWQRFARAVNEAGVSR